MPQLGCTLLPLRPILRPFLHKCKQAIFAHLENLVKAKYMYF